MMYGSILAAIVGFLILLFIYLTTFIDENKREHIFLRLILVFFFLQTLMLVARGVYEDCDYYLNNITAINTTLSENNYIYLCKPLSASNERLMTSVIWLQRVFWIYIIIYLSYYWLLKYKILKAK